MEPIYSLKNIFLNYQLYSTIDPNKFIDIPAIDNLSLEIYENEYLVILGANGSGKSSLAKLLAGLANKYSGELSFKGELVNNYDREVFNDVALVMQEPENQILFPTVRDELAFPLENRGFDSRVINQIINKIASQFGISDWLSKETNGLSGGQITTLAVASALIAEPRIIILDESDSHLDKNIKKVVDKFIIDNKGKLTVVQISQYPDEGILADRVAILNAGHLAAIGKPRDILTDEKLLIESNLKASKTKARITKSNQFKNDIHSADSQPILSLKNVSFAYYNSGTVLCDLSLDLFAGQKTGLAGLSGSGKTTLGLIMAGLIKPQRGEVLIKGKALTQYANNALRRLITMAIQYPERALFEETVAIDVSFGPTNIGYDNVKAIVETQLEEFGIGFLKDRHPFTLSGGQKRKAALVGVLAMQSDIIIFDEPQAGLDPRSVEEFAQKLVFWEDKTLLIISHDYRFLSETCDRIITLKLGKIDTDLAVEQFADNLLID